MSGLNAYTLTLALKYAMAGDSQGASSGGRWNEAALLNELNLAQPRLAELIPDAEWVHTDSIVSGTGEYDLPSNLLSVRVNDDIQARVGDSFLPVQLVSWSRLMELFPEAGDTIPGGTPTHAAVQSGTRQLVLRPVPSVSVASGLRYTYAITPTPLTRIYRPGITATLNGTTAVTFASAVDTSRIRAGDAFGLLSTTDSTGAALDNADQYVVAWYPLASVAGNGLSAVLSSAALESRAAAFVSAQVPDWETLFPGKFNVSHYLDSIIRDKMKTRNPQVALVADQFVRQAVADAKPVTPSSAQVSLNVQLRFPGQFRD